MKPTTISRTRPLRYFLKPLKSFQQPPVFTAALTHEVRNPLTNINLAVEMLRRMEPGTAQQPYLDIILRASKRIDMLVTELAGQQHKQKTERVHSVHQLLEEVLVMAADRIILKNITVSKDYTIQDHNIKENYRGMKIALTNIIINALDAMKERGGILRLVTTSINGNIVLAIEDNGCGIPAVDLQNIFKPFFTNKTGGLGVGLAVTSQLLKANHVKMEVRSEVARGTKFILSFTRVNPVFLISSTA
jgi:signal transduction histidine kinase